MNKNTTYMKTYHKQTRNELLTLSFFSFSLFFFFISGSKKSDLRPPWDLVGEYPKYNVLVAAVLQLYGWTKEKGRTWSEHYLSVSSPLKRKGRDNRKIFKVSVKQAKIGVSLKLKAPLSYLWDLFLVNTLLFYLQNIHLLL